MAEEGLSRAGAPLGLVVYGCRRSGTTLLSVLLSQHPDVHVLNDACVLWALNRACGSAAKRLGWRAVARATGSASAWSKAESSHLPPPEAVVDVGLLDGFYEELLLRYRPKASGGWLTAYGRRLDFTALAERSREGTLTVRQLVDEVHGQLVRDDACGAVVIGEKTPEHAYLRDWMRDAYPSALSVILVREPLTNVTAIRKRNYARSLRAALALYRSTYGNLLLGTAAGRRQFVRYEDLIHAPQEVVSSIYAKLGLAPSLLSEHLSVRTQRGRYTGSSIDIGRDEALRRAVQPADARVIRIACRDVYRMHYSWP